MAVKLSKKTVKPKKTDEVVSEGMKDALMKDMQELVNSIGPTIKEMRKLELELKKLAPKVNKAKAELLELATVYAGENRDEHITVIAENGSAEISKEAQKREITDKEYIIEALDKIEDGLAFSLADFKLGDLDKYLNPNELAAAVKKEYTGSRSVKWG